MPILTSPSSPLGIPVRERREATGTLSAGSAELVLPINGDESATVFIVGGGATLTATFNFEGSIDGTTYIPVIAMPYTPGCLNGTIPVAQQPLIQDSVNSANILRAYNIACGQFKLLRVRTSALTSGSPVVTIISEPNDSSNLHVRDWRPATLAFTASAAVSTALTLSIPAVAGFRHIIDRVVMTAFATVATTASGVALNVTATNIPGTSPVYPIPQEALAIGAIREIIIEGGSGGIATIAINAATTFIMPAYTGVIWRANATYRLAI
jgi:hypothetical protein